MQPGRWPEGTKGVRGTLPSGWPLQSEGATSLPSVPCASGQCRRVLTRARGQGSEPTQGRGWPGGCSRGVWPEPGPGGQRWWRAEAGGARRGRGHSAIACKILTRKPPEPEAAGAPCQAGPVGSSRVEMWPCFSKGPNSHPIGTSRTRGQLVRKEASDAVHPTSWRFWSLKSRPGRTGPRPRPNCSAEPTARNARFFLLRR